MLDAKTLANAIRMLSIDAVQKANSGHPGMPSGMADIAQVLWGKFLNHNPVNPNWFNRDRFILSNGHGSMLQYALLHLSGYSLSLDQLKNFRQLHSQTPGHPEYGDTVGIETTTGPLGQGLANGVGMALAEKILATHFNQDNFNLINHFTYVFTGDGCLMEGISHEACSLAGTLKLGKLIVFYDDNGISIDGKVVNWFDENVPQRFNAYGWHVVENVDGHNPDEVEKAILKAHKNQHQPTIICCKTVIGYGSPNLAGSEKTHGAPLGVDEVKKVRAELNWPHAEFVIPDEIYAAWDAKEKGELLESNWDELFVQYQEKHPKLAEELTRRINHELPTNWQETVTKLIDETSEQQQNVASRKASQLVLEQFCATLPELIGGSADLSGSNNTRWSGSKDITATDTSGNYINYGVREFAMSAIINGLSLHGGFIPYGGTFLIFSDYARNAVRLAALMKAHSIFVYTHDSIGLGEDGPTHQPIEHALTLRATPNLNVWRPCDTLETVIAWQHAIEHKDIPSCLLLSRQTLNYQNIQNPELIKRGGYILHDCEGLAELILIATGSEVELASQAYASLTKDGKKVRVVSMPCCDIFELQDKTYQDEVLPPKVKKRIAIEALSKDSWYKYVGLDGEIIGMNSFGLSAPGKDVFKEFNFTIEHVLKKSNDLLNN